MKNNEISNPKTRTPKGIELNDKDYLNSLLTSLKELAKNYTISMSEASNEVLFTKYFTTFKKIIELQRETYELLFRNGWYKLEVSDQNKIDTKKKTIEEEYTGLNK